jgi:hypothetical protein
MTSAPFSPEFCAQIAQLATLYRQYRAEGQRLVLTEPLKARQAFAAANRIATTLRRLADGL